MKKILIQHKINKLKKSLSSFIFIFIISILIGSIIYIDNKLRPTITVIAETKAIELANRSINKAVANIVDENIEYEDLIYVKTGDNGNIKMMQANYILMNEIASKVALEIQSHPTESQHRCNSLIWKMAVETQTPFVITTDAHMLNADQIDTHSIFVEIGEGREAGETYLGCHLQNEQDVRDNFQCRKKTLNEMLSREIRISSEIKTIKGLREQN